MPRVPARIVLPILCNGPDPDSVHELEDEVALRFYRLQKISEGSIDLEEGEAEPLKGPTDVGTRRGEDNEILLSSLVDKLNERFGTDFNQADQLFFDQVAKSAIENETLKAAAQANTLDNSKHVLDRMLEGLFVDRIKGNEEIFDRVTNDPVFRNIASDHLMKEVYESVRNKSDRTQNDDL